MSSNPIFPNRENELVEALAVCLDALAVDSSLENCLELYPALAEDLRPLLMTALTASNLHPTRVPVESMNRSRTQALARAATLREHRKPLFGFWGWPRRVPRFAWSSALMALVIFAALFTVDATAARSLPGDSLYALKLSVENIRLNLTPGSQAQDALQEIYRERRIDEVRELLAMGREETIRFEGVYAHNEELSGVAPERWLVGDINVLRTIDTQVIGEIEIGMLIEVEGRTRSDGYVEAITLRPRAFAFIGPVEKMTSDVWTVGGRSVQIRLNETKLDPGIELGSQVMVLAEFDEDANIFARAILLTRNPDEGLTPSPTPTQTHTPTLEPPATEQPVDTETPQPTLPPSQTPTLSGTPFPNPTSSPTPEASETENREDDGTSEPAETETDEPEETDGPTETDEPSKTPEPTRTLEPTETDEPTKTEEPTKTDEPDDSSNSGSGGGADD